MSDLGNLRRLVQPTARVARVITLREYQADDVRFIVQTNDDLCIESPTGAGKTLTATTAAAILLREKGYTGGLIGPPMEHIEDGFTDRAFEAIALPQTTSGYASCIYQVPKNFIQAARDNGDIGETIRDYLSVDRDYVLACTHMALICGKLPNDLTRKFLIVDEAHRAPVEGNKFAKIIDKWSARGGRIIFFTATPFRGDGKQVTRDKMRIRRRSLAQHMEEGFAPRNLITSIIPFITSDWTVKRFKGEVAPPTNASITVAKAMVKTWNDDSKPPLMIRVPPIAGGSDRFVQRIIEEFRNEIGDPSRVFDASGVGEKQKSEFIALLRAERERSFETRKVDVIVGIQRTLEGTDWPTCAAIYVYGLPGSPTTVGQLLGRPTRYKPPTHPFADRAIGRFFVETLDENSCHVLQRRQALDALGIACLLGDTESPSGWGLERITEEKINAVAVDKRHQLDLGSDYATGRDDASRFTRGQIALSWVHQKNVGITVGEARAEIVRVARDLDKWAGLKGVRKEVLHNGVNRLLTEQVVNSNPQNAARVKAIVGAKIDKGLVDGFDISESMRQAFAQIVDEFSNDTLTISDGLAKADHHIFTLTGQTMAQYAHRVFHRTPLTEIQIRNLGETFKAANGRYPGVGDTDPELSPGDSWAKIDTALRLGRRGLPGGGALCKLFNYDRPVHNDAQLITWAWACRHRTGKFPTAGLPIDNPTDYGLPDPEWWGFPESWTAIDKALREGHRGLPGGQTLRTFLREHGLK